MPRPAFVILDDTRPNIGTLYNPPLRFIMRRRHKGKRRVYHPIPTGMCEAASIVARAKKFNLASVLSYISQESYRLWQANKFFDHARPGGGPIIRQDGLAFLAKTALSHGKMYRDRPLHTKAFWQLGQMYNDLYDPFLGAPGRNTEALHDFLLRTAYQEFPFQQGTRALIPRALHLYVDLDQRLAPDLDFSLSEQFQRQTGLTPQDFIILGFICLVDAGKNRGYVNSDRITNINIGNLAVYTLPGKVSRFLDIVRCDVPTFTRECQLARISDLYMEKHEFNPLRKFPIVEIESWPRGSQPAFMMLPIPVLMLERLTEGIYWLLLDRFREDGRLNEFFRAFGALFQEYIGLHLARYCHENELLPEITYGHGEKFADWVVLEGDTAIFIQCKTKRITTLAKTTMDMELLQEDLRRGIGEAVIQLAKNARKAREGVQGLEAVSGRQNFMGLVVLPEPVYLANTPYVRSLIEKPLYEEIRKGKLPGISVDDLRCLEYCVMSARELEDHIPLKKQMPFFTILREFMDYDKHPKVYDLPGVENELLKEKFDEFFRELVPRA